MADGGNPLDVLPKDSPMWLAKRQAERESAIRVATFSAKLLNQLDDWPEDDWLGMAQGWDLNLFVRENKRYVTLYPVMDGVIDTSQPTEIHFLREEVIDNG